MQRAFFHLAAACLLCLSSVSTAWAQARIEDCEKIQAADAYNQCLAKFGPTSKVKSVEPFKPGDVKDNGAEAAADATAGHGGGPRVAAKAARHVARGRAVHGRGRHVVTHGSKHFAKKATGGRKRMVITIKRRR